MDKDIPKVVLRVGLAIVFLYFGFSQIQSPDNWIGYLPEFLTGINNVSPNNIIMLNGFVELTLGIYLLIGLYTRFASAILGLHLIGITLSIGLNPVGIRDFGLTIATLVVFLNGVDRFGIDGRMSKKEESVFVQR